MRRPFSVYNTSRGKIEFLYKTVGRGTIAFSKMKPHTAVRILGPLGNGYDLSYIKNGFYPVLVAGGTGVASLNFLASKLYKKGIIFAGAKSKNDIVGISELKKTGWKIFCSTDDGSRGFKGFVTSLCEKHLCTVCGEKPVIYACGPESMTASVKLMADKYGINGFASLERVMACGTGNCQGCVVSAGGSLKRVCKDGPVFSLKELNG